MNIRKTPKAHISRGKWKREHLVGRKKDLVGRSRNHKNRLRLHEDQFVKEVKHGSFSDKNKEKNAGTTERTSK